MLERYKKGGDLCDVDIPHFTLYVIQRHGDGSGRVVSGGALFSSLDQMVPHPTPPCFLPTLIFPTLNYETRGVGGWGVSKECELRDKRPYKNRGVR